MKRKTVNIRLSTVAALAAATLLTACIDWSGLRESFRQETGAPLTLTGTAATGAAIAGGQVEARCRIGTGTTTTGADGSFTLAIEAAALPCVLNTFTARGDLLQGVAVSGGERTVVHLTPITQLVVAWLLPDDAGRIEASRMVYSSKLTPAAVTEAQAGVVAALRQTGVDFGAVPNLMNGPLRPRNGTTPGDAYDQLLDTLAARLNASGTRLAALSSVIAIEARVAAGEPTFPVSFPPLGMLLRPPAVDCGALRSGTYRVLAPTANGGLARQTHRLTLDAPTLVGRDEGSAADNPPWVPVGPCRYRADDGHTDIVVSQAGVIVARTSTDGGATHAMKVAFPEQTHPLAALAGNWNVLGLERNAAQTAFTGVAGSVAVTADGTVTSRTWCQNDATWGLKDADCGTVTSALPTLRANGAGGFDTVSPAGSVIGRTFLYRAGNGDLVAWAVDAAGSLQVRSKQRPGPRPTSGTAASLWTFPLDGELEAQPLEIGGFTIQTGSLSTFTRELSREGLGYTWTESLVVDSPREGYDFCAADQVTTSIGTVVTLGEFTELPLRGMALSAAVRPAGRQFALSVTWP